MLKTYSMDCHNSTIRRGCRLRIFFYLNLVISQLDHNAVVLLPLYLAYGIWDLQYLARYFRIVTLKIDFKVACGVIIK